MKGSIPSGPLILPIARWTQSRVELDTRFPSDESPDLKEADVVGEVRLHGHIDIGPKDFVLHLQVDCRTREICGRSLEEFENEMSAPFQILLHRSGRCPEVDWNDDNDEVFEATIPADLRALDIAEVVRQVIELERPISPIKPGTALPPGALPEEEPTAESPVDPRWARLAKLKGNQP